MWTEIFRKYSPKTLVVLEGVIPLETFPLVEWHEGELADVPSFTVLKTQICVTRPQCVKVHKNFYQSVSDTNTQGHAVNSCCCVELQLHLLLISVLDGRGAGSGHWYFYTRVQLNQSAPSGLEITNEWTCTSAPLKCLYGMHRDNVSFHKWLWEGSFRPRGPDILPKVCRCPKNRRGCWEPNSDRKFSEYRIVFYFFSGIEPKFPGHPPNGIITTMTEIFL